jgi:hemoglobin
MYEGFLLMADNPSTTSQTIFQQLGEDGFDRLVAAFYRRVSTDTVLRPLYPNDDLIGAERRLRLFLMQYFGGPTTYSEERGHPRLRMRHAPYTIGTAERDAWIADMLGAMDDVGIPEPAYTVMKEYFQRGADFMMNVSPFGGMMQT